MGRFDGKVAWVTGGGSGIGKAVALAFAREGARVAVSGRRKERLDAVVAELEAAGAEAFAAPCDVTDDDTVAGALAAIVERFGQLDVAVANAGFSVSGRFEKLTTADWRRQMDVNVVGLATTVRLALPELQKTQGRVALVASVMGHMAVSGSSAYAASKFAVRAIGLTLSQELHGSGVTCTTIHPGFVESEIAKVDNRGTFKAERKDNRPQRFMWPADKAGAVIVRAIHKRKREYVFTWHGKVGAWLGRHAPGVVHFAMTRSGNKKKALATSKTGG